MTAPDDPHDAQVLRRLIAARHSCRGFLATPVPADVIEKILRTAQGAASWCNSQPWNVIVTQGQATERFRDALHAYAKDRAASGQSLEEPDFPFPRRYVGVYKERQRQTGWALYESVGVTKGDREGSARQALENFRLFGAPHVMIVTTEDDLGIYGAIDCGIYVGNLLLAAQSFGVATIAQAALAGVADFVRQYFDIPPHRRIVCAVSFGYEDADHPANRFRTTRAPLDAVATFLKESPT